MKAVFLDKDGTLIENLPFNTDPDLIRFTPFAREGLTLLQKKGYRIFVVTNQPGIALGRFSEDNLSQVREHVASRLASWGVELSDFLYCPHHPQGVLARYSVDCRCRKPRPGLLLDAIDHYELAARSCWMVGDILDDIEAGSRAGCRTVLLNNGNETEWIVTPLRKPGHVVSNLLEAARVIVEAARDE